MPITFYPEGNRALPSDNEMRSLHKLVDLFNSGAGGAGGVYIGNGAPSAASIPVNKNAAAVYYQRDNAYAQWVWDVSLQQWV